MTTLTSLLDHLYEGDVVDTADLARVSDTNPRSVARWKAETATPRRAAEERLLERAARRIVGHIHDVSLHVRATRRP